eukprot:CAMPEP_0119329984 /NCGR_PEP_ID=MMETSP1333-20130426/77227_1 /TAXON_ID=418940 /ORGANISM="Scyphosphaera apsteinii, Strain RCC1455" /LENGTH=112 /DNA_ID=CAMNT_0007339251 /DNA_START=19 /DNA_END=357 /DNA_ORIENTATION=+
MPIFFRSRPQQALFDTLSELHEHSSKCRDVRRVQLDKSQGALGITIGNNDGEEGVQLLSLLVGSIAWLAGLQVGDIILSVNGVAARTHEQTIEQVDSAEGVIELEVVSSGQS